MFHVEQNNENFDFQNFVRNSQSKLCVFISQKPKKTKKPLCAQNTKKPKNKNPQIE